MTDNPSDLGNYVTADTSGPVGSVDLDHVNIVGMQCLCEPCAVAAGALDASAYDFTKAAGPGDRGVVAGRAGAEFGVAEKLAGVGDSGEMNGVQMGVGADNNPAVWGCHDGGVLSVAMNRAVGDNPVGRADKTLMRNGQAPD